MNNGIMNMWNNRSDEYFKDIQTGLDQITENAENAFPVVVWKMINKEFPNLRGKRVLVPSSGDNIAVFGFHLLGAKVTSCDIAERQLMNAKKIADNNGWNIEFIRQDSMTLDAVQDGEYDLVYTSNGVHVWISDLPKMYSNFRRVLKPDGRYIMFETHPFIRPFDDCGTEIKVCKPYEDTGPFISEEEITFGWRIKDLFNAVFDSGFNITHMEEFHPGKNEYEQWFYSHHMEAKEDDYKKFDWKQNPWAALPQWIGFTARKDGQ
jgi:SAM-dependent methyltransferase